MKIPVTQILEDAKVQINKVLTEKNLNVLPDTFEDGVEEYLIMSRTNAVANLKTEITLGFTGEMDEDGTPEVDRIVIRIDFDWKE